MEILVILLLIFMNGFLSMSEIALVSSRKSRLEIDAKKGNLAAKRILKMSEKPERFLSTIQIGITLIGILTGLYSGEALSGDFARFLSKWPLLEPIASGLSKTIIVIVVTYVTLIFGELLPKRIGMSAAEKNIQDRCRPHGAAVQTRSSFCLDFIGFHPGTDAFVSHQCRRRR
jgi:putative hemolysin